MLNLVRVIRQCQRYAQLPILRLVQLSVFNNVFIVRLAIKSFLKRKFGQIIVRPQIDHAAELIVQQIIVDRIDRPDGVAVFGVLVQHRVDGTITGLACH